MTSLRRPPAARTPTADGRRAAHRAARGLLLLAVGACGDRDVAAPVDGPSDGARALVRVMNASPVTPRVDLMIDGYVSRAAVPFNDADGPCVSVPPGERTVALRADDRMLASSRRTFEAGATYLVVLAGVDPTGRAGILLRDLAPREPAPGEMALRFINAMVVEGDVFLSTSGQRAPPGDPIARLGPGGTTEFVLHDATDARVRLYATDDDPEVDAPVADVRVQALPASRTGTVVFTGSDAGESVGGVFVAACR